MGMEYTPTFCDDLSKADLGGGSVLEKLERLYEALKEKQYLPKIVCELGKAWCRDVGKLL